MLSSRTETAPLFATKQITHGPFGHCLNSTQCFSPDGRYIVYDTRNDDSKLAANGQVRIVDAETGDDILLYETANQSAYGPGVGAATFSPDGKTVLFLGGIQNAAKDNPYSFTRRTGIGVAIAAPGVPIWMDARDIRPPFTPGALRGGTHAHSWSGDGSMISFTYNDHILSEQIKTNPEVIDTRTVGLMFRRKVEVPDADGVENKNGEWFSVLVSKVTKHPRPGSDEISKAFDECWIGTDGYLRPDGTRQRKAIAFQGHVKSRDGHEKTSIFIVDIPDEPSVLAEGLSAGTTTSLPPVPAALYQRRITSDKITIAAVPRHWLRATPDGSTIGFLAEDAMGIVQLWTISPNGGDARRLTSLPASVSGPFNFSHDGKYAAFTAGGLVYVTRLSDGVSFAATTAVTNIEVLGPVAWAPGKNVLAYNAYVNEPRGRFLQVFTLTIH